MRQRSYNYIAVVLFFAGVSVGFAGRGSIFLDKEFSLGLGQTAIIEEDRLAIKFKAVLEDSRCPVNAVCVWAGNGKVEFEVVDIDGQKKSIILNTDEEPKAETLKKHELTLIALNPPRMEGVAILPKDYSVSIHVQKK